MGIPSLLVPPLLDAESHVEVQSVLGFFEGGSDMAQTADRKISDNADALA